MRLSLTIVFKEKVSLDQAIEMVGGYVELVRLTDFNVFGEAVMLVDEDGRSKDLPTNPAASIIANQIIRGSAVILVGREAQEGWTWEDLDDDLSPSERRER